jgi:DNA-directed RNA polymerase subunit RPC12/RpoP
MIYVILILLAGVILVAAMTGIAFAVVECRINGPTPEPLQTWRRNRRLTDGDDYHCEDCGESFEFGEVAYQDPPYYQCPLCSSYNIQLPGGE